MHACMHNRQVTGMSAHSAAGVSGAQLGTENVTPNSAVDTFRTEAWNEFLHLYGTLRPPHPPAARRR